MIKLSTRKDAEYIWHSACDHKIGVALTGDVYGACSTAKYNAIKTIALEQRGTPNEADNEDLLSIFDDDGVPGAEVEDNGDGSEPVRASSEDEVLDESCKTPPTQLDLEFIDLELT